MAKQNRARDRMIDSAAYLFAQHGIASTAIADVLEHSKSPRGSAYHYFPGGKEQLAQEATLHAGRAAAEQLNAVLATQGPIGALGAFLDQFRRGLIASDFTRGCPIAAAAVAPRARGVSDSAGEVFTSWEASLTTALWRSGLDMARAEDIAAYALSAVEGALLLARAQRTTRPLDSVGRELTLHLRSILGAPDLAPRPNEP